MFFVFRIYNFFFVSLLIKITERHVRVCVAVVCVCMLGKMRVLLVYVMDSMETELELDGNAGDCGCWQ